MAKGTKTKGSKKIKLDSPIVEFAIPKMPFEEFHYRLKKYWEDAWKMAEPDNYQKYFDLLYYNPNWMDNNNLLNVETAYSMYTYNWDVHHRIIENRDPVINSEIIIEFKDISIPIILDCKGIRLLKTVYKTFDTLVKEVEDFNVPYLLTLRDYLNTPRIDYLINQDDGAKLFLTMGSFLFTEQLFEVVDPFTIDEIRDNNIIQNQDEISLLLSLPEISSELYSTI